MFSKLSKKLFGRGESKEQAKSRLHFVLVQDRTGLSNEDMRQFKSELVEVIERYFTINENEFDITYQRDGDSTTLLINSPVVVRANQKAQGKSQPKKRAKKGAEPAAANA